MKTKKMPLLIIVLACMFVAHSRKNNFIYTEGKNIMIYNAGFLSF